MTYTFIHNQLRSKVHVDKHLVQNYKGYMHLWGHKQQTTITNQ
jgi:hypothetical protein